MCILGHRFLFRNPRLGEESAAASVDFIWFGLSIYPERRFWGNFFDLHPFQWLNWIIYRCQNLITGRQLLSSFCLCLERRFFFGVTSHVLLLFLIKPSDWQCYLSQSPLLDLSTTGCCKAFHKQKKFILWTGQSMTLTSWHPWPLVAQMGSGPWPMWWKLSTQCLAVGETRDL